MKKFLLLLLSICLTISCLSSCGNKKKQALKSAENVYVELSTAAAYCEEISEGIYGAWYFAIYEAKGYGYGDIILNYTKRTGIDDDSLLAVAESYGYNILELLDGLKSLDFALEVTLKALEINDTTPKFQTALSDAKENLDTLSDKHIDFEDLSKLKSLYNKIKAYSEKLLNFAGMNFYQLEDHIDKYKPEIEELLSELDYLS
ncbi:MAG: hypothetical protein E7360_00730 [Clostridiales bacterium]|nr:hypothetical protein [Clostridiales bacterium]